MKARLLWVLPVAVVGSWLAVRTLGASMVVPPPRPMVAMTTLSVVDPVARPEIKDHALAKLISRHAMRARQK
ncbi:MAG TPA: hypothetical protein VNO55_33520 [Polyangia bacterium]|nr:hypothetical protein [Polyangia bacterium]